MADDVVLNIRERGARQAAREVKEFSGALGGVRRAGELAAVGLRNFRQNTGLSTNSLYLLRHSAYAAGAALTGIGVLGVRAGLQFNATMESNQIAFTQFLGSTTAARKELSFLYKTAASTPFETTNITTAARQLLAFGFNAKEANSWLGTIGDTISGMGGGAQQIDQLVTAIGQIRSKGRLQGDELMQLSELGVVNRQRLAKDLGLTPLELMSGNSNVSAQRALRALKKQFDDTFGGQSAKQAQTFNGQLSTLHDNINMTLGAITKPAFNQLEKRVFPALNAASGDINKIFGRQDIDMSQKITLSRAVLKRRLGPFVDELEAQIGSMHLDEKLGELVGAAIPRIAEAAGRAGPPAAAAFANAWLHSGPWGQLLSIAWFGSKLGAFDGIGRNAGGKFGRGFIFGAVGAAAAYEAARAAAKVLGGGPVALAGGLADSEVAQLNDPTVRAGRILAGDQTTRAAIARWRAAHHMTANQTIRLLQNDPASAARMGYPGLIPGAPGVPAGYRPTVSPAGAKAMHISVYIDGKGVAHHMSVTYGKDTARGVSRAVADARARR